MLFAFGQKSIMEEIQPGLMHEIERFFVLTQTDNLFKEHLQAIKFLQQAVGLRGYAQRDPLTEFKLEAYNLFIDMQVRYAFHLSLLHWMLTVHTT